MPGDVRLADAGAGSLDLRNLIDTERLEEVQDSFADETGLGMITVDSMGEPVTRASGFSPLCQFLRQDPEFRKRCSLCDAQGGFQAALQNKAFVYRCHAGLVDFSVPMLAGRQYVGAIMAGQVQLREGTDQLGHIVRSTRFDAATRNRVDELYEEIHRVDVGRLERAAARIVELAGQVVDGDRSIVSLGTPTYRGRRTADEQPAAETLLASLSARSIGPWAALPDPTQHHDETLQPAKWLEHLERSNIAGNLELLDAHLYGIMPRWSQKVSGEALAGFEDLMMSLAASKGQGVGREISRLVIEQRNRRKSSLNRYAVQTYCERLLVTLHNLAEPARAADERTIESLLNEIEKDPTSYLSVGSAAEFLSWSESHFARQFRKATGMSYIQYVTGKRMERARFLLAHTDLPVMRIAATLKFQPLNYFSRTFRKEVGISPTQYRERLGQEA